MGTNVVQVTPERAALAEALTNLTAHAKRQPYVVKRFTDDKPTKWDQAHAKIDDHLALWTLAQ